MADFFIGESLVGEGNEVAHIDLVIGSKTGPAGAAFCNALTNNKDGFTTLLAVVAPNLAAKPDTILFNKVTIKGAKQAVQMFGPAQAAVARAVVDSVESGVIPNDKADDYVVMVGVFIHWDAATTRRSTTTTTRRRRNRSSARWPTSRPSRTSSPVPRPPSTPSAPSKQGWFSLAFRVRWASPALISPHQVPHRTLVGRASASVLIASKNV